jgi:hypothetical protein
MNNAFTLDQIRSILEFNAEIELSTLEAFSEFLVLCFFTYFICGLLFNLAKLLTLYVEEKTSQLDDLEIPNK